MSNLTEASPYQVRPDGQVTGPAGEYLVWYHHWGVLMIEPCDTFEEALRRAYELEESETGYPECIEGPAGLVPDAVVTAWNRAKDAEDAATRQTAAASDEGRVSYAVMVRHLDGERSGQWASFETRAAAVEAAAYFPASRVQITSHRWKVAESGLYHPHDRTIVKDWDDPMPSAETGDPS